MFGRAEIVPFIASVRVGVLDFSADPDAADIDAIGFEAANFLEVIRTRLTSIAGKLSEAQRGNHPDQGRAILILHPLTGLDVALAGGLAGTDPLRLVLDRPFGEVLNNLPGSQAVIEGREVIAAILSEELQPEERERVAEQAREILLRQCDLLIAIVDEAGEVQNFLHPFVIRERRALPVIAIPVSNPSNALFVSIESNRIEQTGNIKAGLNAWMDRLLSPRDAARLQFKKWEPGFTYGGAYPYLLWILTGDRPNAESFWIHKYDKRAETALAIEHLDYMSPANQQLWQEIRAQYSMDYVWSDRLALYFGNLARTHILILMFAGLIATCAILVGLFNKHTAWHQVEGVALAAVILSAVLIWLRRLQQNWLDYRLLAELIRPMPYLAAIGGRFNPATRTKGKNERAWNRSVWQYQSISRAARIPTLRIGPDYLADAKMALTDLVTNQIEWHGTNEAKQHKAHSRLHRMALIAFISVVAISMSHSVLSLLRVEMPETRLNALLLVAGVLTALASVFGSALCYFGFDQIADRSEAALREFEQLKTRMDRHQERPTIEQVTTWATELTAIMAEEQLAWHNQMSNITIHLG